MKAPQLIDLIDDLGQQATEREWFEFKRNHVAPEDLGKYLSALSNSACLAYQAHGFLIMGIDDASHTVVGTPYDPYNRKGKGNQDLLPWLRAKLQPYPGVDVHEVDHPHGRVVVFAIQPARGQPICFDGRAYVRVGSNNAELRRYPEKERAIWTSEQDWSAEVCESATLDDLDPEGIIRARDQFVDKHPVQASTVQNWDTATFLNKARVLKQGQITYTALLLLGRPEATALLSPAEAKISWILKDGDNREMDYAHLYPPFLLAGDRLLERIRNLTVRDLPHGTLFPRENTQYDTWVIREALHNCIAHQDYGLHGRIVVVEFPDRILLVNDGDFSPGSVEEVIRQDAPQTIYRNRFLIEAMVELNLIDTQGGGIKRMFQTQWQRRFPLPDYNLSDSGQVRVCLHGRILDERYTQLLMEKTDLDLDRVMLLDRVQKRQRIPHDEFRRLKAAGLVEGRYSHPVVAGLIMKATDMSGKHILDQGFDKQYYLDLILKLARVHGPVSRKDMNDVLMPKLPDRLTEKQKQSKVHNLLQELRRSGRIANQGTRARPAWVLVETHDG